MKKSNYFVWIIISTIVLWWSAFALTQQRLGNALISANTLPADWCQHMATIGNTRYAFDASSYALIEKAFSKLEYGKNVRQRIWYTITWNTWTVTCGWGSQQTLPEIHVDFFVPKK